MIRWKLSELMARHRIKGKELANYLGISANSVSALKRAELMPEIGGERWEQICEAINELSCLNEKCTPFDLVEYVPSKDESTKKYDSSSRISAV
ncbi:putative transcriptional regulator [Rivularia sp. PCC 7116]|uniref:helix-turn-helix domain-containing protein n=1 Tax=Rivularia sp. PCC 7116 TaxID=373994 RepID=UPI00029F3E9E|nr:helix-turn-helix domain-containing protein [Rivularia sp. PCC 7116]AFY58640.1 putative transcriptional regulator [Rivularia sp. PCC 7116]